ncbi:hsp70-binding protein 1 [Struthio camelus]|uniref:hsp70-binding protein 1 n=1 Tax=Struthio camelus TaxID=8801 RepID=UPI003603D30E
MAEQEAGGPPPPREPPRSLQGLLEMAVTASEPQAEPREPLSDERREWLGAAVAAALGGVGGESEQLRRCLRLLREPQAEAEAESSPEHVLELLAELCESLDNATELCALGGLETAAGLLEDARAPVRTAAARLVGACGQNLPGAAGRALALGCLPALLRRLRAEPEPGARRAALFALSCLLRARAEGLEQFERLGGLPALLEAACGPPPPLRAKAAFLLHSLLRQHPRLKEPLCRMGTVPRLVALLRAEPDAGHEHVLGVLCSLATDFAPGAQECRAPELGLERLLRERSRLLRGREECQEELEFCEQLLLLCFGPPPEEGAADR